ncbi:baseplate J/gp47 family protein [Klebsiella pneumoniae]|uniref:Baseplate protein J n=1 Tax=Aeromonas phage ZPAH14 TaxID=2924887 RepID=A0AAE9H107_9CAUD|nr:baseplate protein J [Aeromonas phage ZPAH14]UOT58050.1 baseplate protein J [Aeromonas phage ZPAH14]
MTGITEKGIAVKTYDEVVASLESRFKLEFGDAFDVTPESPDGQNLRIMAAFIHDQWLLAEQAYHSYNPSVVTGVGLDNLVRLNGITRIVDEPTKVGLTFNATTSIGETVPMGTICETSDKVQFQTLSDVVIPGEVLAQCTQLGAINIGPNEVTKIVSDLPDDVSVNNFEAGVTGIVRETDSQLRARRERSLVRVGTSTAEAIYSAVADLNLEFIAVLENDTDATVDGIPPHAFMTVVEGSTLALVAERVYRNKPIGIQAYGSTIITIKDSQGYDHEIGLSRPTPVPIYVRVKVVRPENAAINSLRDIRNALVDHVQGLQIATDVEWAKMFGPAVTAAPQVNIKSIEISKDGTNWQMADIDIGTIERATTDNAKVTVEELS